MGNEVKRPINCEEAEKIIPLYVAGLLDDPAALEDHIASCKRCRDRVTKERFIEETLRTLKPVEPPQGLKEEILSSLGRYKRSGILHNFWRKPVFWSVFAAAIVVLILIAVFMGRQEPKLLEAAPLTGEVLFPSQDAVVLAKDFKLVFVYAPERPDIDVSIYIDDGDVTGTSKAVDGVIIYRSERLDEGYHKIWVRLKDRRTGEEKEFQRLVYVIGGEEE